MKIELEPVSRKELLNDRTFAESSQTVALRVVQARERAAHRLRDTPWRLNGEVPGSALRRTWPPAPGSLAVVERSLERGLISARGVVKVIRVAWTLADLAGRPAPPATTATRRSACGSGCGGERRPRRHARCRPERGKARPGRAHLPGRARRPRARRPARDLRARRDPGRDQGGHAARDRPRMRRHAGQPGGPRARTRPLAGPAARAAGRRRIADACRDGIRLICPGDAEWPGALDQLGQARPYALWLRGRADLRFACSRSVSIVGSRAATSYGGHVAGEIAADLGERGWAVVSGGAYGIDAAAHRGALAAEGVTIAVLACGVDYPYPAGHADLFAAIAAQGLVISEWPPGRHPARMRFLVRNRVIAALAAAP